MEFIRKQIDQIKPQFEKGGKLERFYFIFEAFETFLYAPDSVAPSRGAHIRDAIDLKRMMNTVIVSMLPCLLWGIWNVGHMHYLAVGEVASEIDKILLGLKIVLPIVVVSYASGLGTEFVFATIRRHPVNEGFLVTGMLIPLVMPPTVPLWQVAVGTVFAVIVAKEVFGGTGYNILNVALSCRAFLYFAYPSELSGDVWTYIGDGNTIEGYSGATALAIAAEFGASGSENLVIDALNSVSWAPGLFSEVNLFMGSIPGSIGETSTLMCLLGALILILTRVGSWKIMVSVVVGALLTGYLFNLIGANNYMLMPAHYHLVIGGFAFGTVYMATDPVTASQTERGKWIYGFLIGMITVIIRVLNPAYPEGIMMAILLLNVFAPLIDHYVVEANKKRRLKRATV